MNRRSVLRSIGIGALAAPTAASQAMEQLNTFPMAAPGQLIGGMGNCSQTPTPFAVSHWDMARQAFANPKLKSELWSQLFVEQSHVSFLDPDIANKRSWSLASKIAFQRQRNVERAYERMTMQHVDVFQRIFNWFQNR